MLMSNVIEGAEKRPTGSIMSPIAQDATAALVLCAHEAIEESFTAAADRIAASAGQLDKLEALGFLLCVAVLAAARRALSAAAVAGAEVLSAAERRRCTALRRHPGAMRVHNRCVVGGVCLDVGGSRPSTEPLVCVCK